MDSFGKTVLFALFMLISSCVMTDQDLYKRTQIKIGMTDSQVVSAFGATPAVTSQGDGFVEWHYCETRGTREGDAYFAIFLVDGVVVDTQYYVVDFSSAGGLGSCENFARRGAFRISPKVASAVKEKEWLTEIYDIDLLRVTTRSLKVAEYCDLGSVHVVVVEGQISPDSSFAMSRILERLKPCSTSDDRLIMPVTVSLQSGGGVLADGYALGETLRRNNVIAVIESEKICASSCAVAFLGGTVRRIDDKGQIMFHAPYFSGKNEYGERDIDCDVGEESLSELKDYYISMTDKETGERLFERTMWYCSANDGWVVTGGAAAELYGIATER